jgi:glycosyltransferase involved in cell wall biosynthesis
MAAVLKVKEDKFFVIKHPEFPAEIFPKSRAVELLGKKYKRNIGTAGSKNFLMFGAIAGYKGILQAAGIFKDLPGKNLIIAGPVKRWDKKYFKEVTAASKGLTNIFIYPEVIPDEMVPAFINSADFLLFNFSGILTSGSVTLGISYKKKIILPAEGCLRELNDDNIIKFEPGSIEELKHILTDL